MEPTSSTTVVIRPYRLQPFEAWISVVAIYAGLSHFVPMLPRSGPAAAVELKFPGLVAAWSLMYAAGGVLMIWGLVRRCAQVEGAGLSLLGGGAAVAFIATLAVHAPVLPTVIGLGGVVAACVARTWVLWRAGRVR